MSSSLLGQQVHVYPPVTPSGCTHKIIVADTPLEITNQNSPHTTSYTITEGKILHINRVLISTMSNASQHGSRIEIIYEDSSGEDPVEYVFDRIHDRGGPYVRVYLEESKTRDGTTMEGLASSAGKLLIRRTRLSSASQEIDVVIDAFEGNS